MGKIAELLSFALLLCFADVASAAEKRPHEYYVTDPATDGSVEVIFLDNLGATLTERNTASTRAEGKCQCSVALLGIDKDYSSLKMPVIAKARGRVSKIISTLEEELRIQLFEIPNPAKSQGRQPRTLPYRLYVEGGFAEYHFQRSVFPFKQETWSSLQAEIEAAGVKVISIYDDHNGIVLSFSDSQTARDSVNGVMHLHGFDLEQVGKPDPLAWWPPGRHAAFFCRNNSAIITNGRTLLLLLLLLHMIFQIKLF